MTSQHKKQDHLEILEKKLDHHQLVLYNDDVNTFDFVIESLMQVCKHDRLQAEQCTLLVHYTGKCTVKEGSFSALRPLCEALLDRGLSSVIE
jgi:ATP-dependent Clp protease adaptor protein ClpS